LSVEFDVHADVDNRKNLTVAYTLNVSNHTTFHGVGAEYRV